MQARTRDAEPASRMASGRASSVRLGSRFRPQKLTVRLVRQAKPARRKRMRSGIDWCLAAPLYVWPQLSLSANLGPQRCWESDIGLKLSGHEAYSAVDFKA